MAVKVPPLLHKMSITAQKAWYKKHGMEMPAAEKSSETKERSAAVAKRVKVEPRKTIAVEPGSVRALNAARQQAYMAKGGRQPIGAMGSGGSNVMAGSGHSTIKDLKASIKAGFNPKVSLDPYVGEKEPKKKKVEEAAKPDASMAMTHQLKMKMMSDKDKRTLGKVAALMAAQKNKDKKNEYVRQLGLKAMKAGEVDPARGHSPTRFGREALKKEEVESVEEGVATAQKVMDRASVVAKTNPDPKKRFAASGLARKAMLRTINPTGVNTGIVRGGGNKTYRMLGKVPPYQLTKKTGVSEEVEQIEEGFNKSSPAHMKARDLVSRSTMKAVYHSDGSATIHTTGDENVSSATKVDHIHRDAGLDHNKPASAYKNSTKSKGGLTFKTKETDGSHQVHISYKGMKEEVEQIDEIKISDVIKATRGKSPEEKQKIIQQMRDKENASKPKTAPRKLEPPKDIPMHQRVYPDDMKYHGDSVELEGPVMNEVTKKEAEATLGGSVKEKPKMPPGKQPAGYRYARNLARKAMKAGLKKEDVNEAVKGAEDVGEYDYEGDMAKSQLRSILTNAKRLHDMLEDTTNLPEWVQSKITLAEDYIVTAANYMEGEMNEEFTDKELAKLSEAKMTDAQMKKREKYVKSMKPVSDWEKRYPGRGEQVMYATATKMAMKEETDQIDEGADRWEYSGTVNGKDYTITVPRGADLSDHLGHKKIQRENPHLEPHEVKAVADTSGEDEEHVEVEHEGKKYTHHVTNNQEPRMVYGEEVEHVTEKYMGFAKLKASIAARGGARDPAAVAAAIGRKKYGKEKFQAMAAAGKRKANEETEVVAEAEGKLAVTPKEKELAAHHGDKTRITYGDVIKARIKSAAEKAMKKGN